MSSGWSQVDDCSCWWTTRYSRRAELAELDLSEWKGRALCLVKDRLYLVEGAKGLEDEEGELLYPLRGRRIFVLSLQGDTLQVYTNPVEGQFFTETLCCFDGKLLAPVRSGHSSSCNEMVALRGV